MAGWRQFLVLALLGVTAIPVVAGSGKQPFALTVTDPVSKVECKAVLRDVDGNGCWDEISGHSPSGAAFSSHVLDGQCNVAIKPSLQVKLIDGSLESSSYVIALFDEAAQQTIGLLLKDASSQHVDFIPSLHSSEGKGAQASVENIGIQMSVGGERAVIAVPDDMNASVSLVQSNGESTALFSGELVSGNTTIALPSTITSGEYTLSVVTDKGTQSVSFTLQR